MSSKTTLPEIWNELMQADKHRLRREWYRLQKDGSAEEAKLQQWQVRASRSAERRRQRYRSFPVRDYDPELPISSHRDEIVKLLQDRQTIVVCGETGSGKSTQLPKFCLDAGLGASGVIGHTQPRRLAARAVSQRLAQELNTSVGDLVGFKIRFTDTTKDQTLVKLMTDGVLLAETQSDRFLEQYDALIIDEAHERSLNIDFLLGYLRNLQSKRPDLKLIITSATIDPERFSKHFCDEHGPAPIVEVSGRTYPVEMRYRPMMDDADTDPTPGDETSSKAIAEAVDELTAEGSGDILTFLPTERDIRLTAKYLRGHFARQGRDRHVEVLPLYARLSHAEQNKIFGKHAKQRIILATNVAESSLTVPGIRYVIDTGLVRISRYAPRSRVRRLPIESVSQASANQRAGRCGRLGPGICIRLFSEEDFESRKAFTTPEIKRSDLASVILQSHILRLGRLEDFPLLEMPAAESIRDGRRALQELGALDDEDRLTAIGKKLGKLPCEPRVGRMLLEADERQCLAEVLVIAAAIECQDVRQRPANQKNEADEAHAEFQDPHSDFLTYLRLWDFFETLRSKLGRSRLQKALQQKFLSYQGFREWADTVRQLRELLVQAKIHVGKRQIDLPPIEEQEEDETNADSSDRRNDRRGKRGRQGNRDSKKRSRPEGYAEIHQSLLSGLLSGIALKGDRHIYTAARGLEISLWPGSGLFARQPKWIVASEIVETGRRYGRTVAEIDPEWIESAGRALLKHTYSEPHWSSKTGSAMVYRRSTLFGLPVVAGRRTSLAPIDPDLARELLIEHGLVAGQWRCREEFYRHNQELLKDVEELVQRTRATHFIVDRFHLAAFYQQRLPREIVHLKSLQNWIKKHRGEPEERALWMKAEDLLESPQDSTLDISHDYPNFLEIQGSKLPLHYHFEPGSESDGVTVLVPQPALRQISEEALGWLVPGLLEEKILCLIRSLPKSQRTAFVPAPDVAKQLTRRLDDSPRDRPFQQELCRVMSEHSGERVKASDFNLEKVPPHLRFRISVIDDEGHEIDRGRNIRQLQEQHAPSNATVPEPSEEAADWKNREVTPQTFDGLAEQVTVVRGGVKVAAFPALVDLGTSVELQLAATPEEAQRESLQGFTRLFAVQHHRRLRSQVAHLPNLSQCEMQLASRFPNEGLREQLELLIARIALVEDQHLIRDQETFEARNAQASHRISVATQEVAGWLPKLAAEPHSLRLAVEQAPASWQEVVDDINEQMSQLLAQDFLKSTPWHGLAEYPRYLKAANLRLEKMSHGGLPKDRNLNAAILRARSAIAELQAETESSHADALDQLRWMLEEFRVSVFAQQLGTKMSVSEKRIQKQIEAVRQG